jgi:quercetin dioxygenase-like cupin family protein
VIRRGEHMAGDVRPPVGRFTGAAEQRTFHDPGGSHAVRVSFVRFEPGTLTYWHRHSGGQVLHVVEGSGRHRVAGGEVETLGEGDTARVAPGVSHWHGAAPGSAMAHLAVSIGEIEWEGPPDP